MIDSAQIQAAHMIDRYLANQLSAEEAAAFEERLLEHPQLQADIEVARRLKQGLATLRERGELDTLVTGKRGMSRGPLLGLAASVLLAIGIGTFTVMHRGPPMLAASIEAFAPERRRGAIFDLSLVRQRDSSRVEFDMPVAGQLIAIHILTGARAADSRFDLQITRDGVAKPLARVEDLLADGDATVTVYFDAHGAGAGPGDYRVRLVPRTTGNEELEPEEFLLRIGPVSRP